MRHATSNDSQKPMKQQKLHAQPEKNTKATKQLKIPTQPTCTEKPPMEREVGSRAISERDKHYQLKGAELHWDLHT